MNTCKYILKKGECKGKVCGARCRNGKFCKSHNERRKKWVKQYYHDNKEEILIRKKKSICKRWDTILFYNCKKHDKLYNYYFNLDVKWINKILHHQEYKCYHCSNFLLLENGNRDPEQASIDRIDNSLGHIKGNVVLACWDCNNKRHTIDIKKFTPNPKYTILKDNEHSEESSDESSEETDVSTSQTGNQNCNQM